MPGERLAKRKAREEELVKFRVLPDDLRVQHGVHGSEVYEKLHPCSLVGGGGFLSRTV